MAFLNKLFFILFLFSATAFANIISKIIIQGNLKIETETIKYKLITQVGQKLSKENIRKDIKAIYSLGYCNDIKVEKSIQSDKSIHLYYIVKEKPIIKNFEYEGNYEISTDDIKDANKVKPYSIINRKNLSKSVKEIVELYEKKGFYLAEVKYKISKPINNEVTVTFVINEHQKVLVKKLLLLGNKKFSDEKLKSILRTKEGESTSFMSSKGTFNEDLLKQDLEIIKYYYMTFGYIQIKVDTPEIVLSPDKKFIYVTINITEGVSFNLGSISLKGEFLENEPREKLAKNLLSKRNEVFNKELLTKDIVGITQTYEDYGYAFANVVPDVLVNEQQRVVDIVLDIEKGPLVHFGKITVKGNSRTRDKVIRREMKILEGEIYNGTNLRKSRENILRLGYFSEVNLTTPHSKNKKNVLDVEIDLKEKQTGSLQIGAGFSSYEKFMANATVSENNFLGYGQTMSLRAQYSKRSKDITASFDEPYLFDTVWSAGTDLFYRTSQTDQYKEKTIGGSIRAGYPIGEYSRLYATTKAEYVFLNNNTFDYETFRFPPPHDNEKFYIMDDDMLYSLQLSILQDTRDNRSDPTKGYFASASYEYSFGSFNFHQTNLEARYYHPLFWSLVSRTRLNYGYIHSLGKKGIPENKRFKLGGIFSIRGYNYSSISPKTFVSKIGDDNPYLYPYGGVHKIVFNKEIQFDIIKEAGLKGVLFFDGGNTYDEFDSLSSKVFKNAKDNQGIYMSFGWGFRWFSPLGPLRFEFGYPIPYKGGVEFEFMIGNFF